MTGLPSPDEPLLAVRRAADRMLSLLRVLHLPAAFGLAAVHGTWLAAVLSAAASPPAPLCWRSAPPGRSRPACSSPSAW